MARERPTLGVPFGAEGPWLAAILDVLHDLHDLIDERWPRPAGQDGDGPVRVSEPAPAGPPPRAVPVSEPAPDVPGEDVEPVTEPGSDLPYPPPRAGRGSSAAAWAVWAATAGVATSDGMSRDDIIAACVSAGVINNDT